MKTLDFHYDAEADTLNICGVRYAGELFRTLGFGPTNTWIKITSREDGVIWLQSAQPDAEMIQPLAELSEALDNGWMLTIRKRGLTPSEEKSFVATLHPGGMASDAAQSSHSQHGIAAAVQMLENFARSQPRVRKLL